MKTDEKELIELLKFAKNNLRYVVPYCDSDVEFDFCVICGQPEWNHKSDCKGVSWEKRVKEILGK